MKFKINNTRHIYVIGNYSAIIPAIYFIVVLLCKWFFPEHFATLFYILLIIMAAYGIPYFILVRTMYDVDYDGLKVRYKTFSGEKTIDLMKVKSVKYGLKKGFQMRGKRNYIYLEFESSGNSEKPIILYDYVPEKDIEKRMNGDHTEYPLLLMYDDIVSKYPDKAGQVRGWG